jgi:NAD(P)-dependent dehydrogenase (short-subunit alcohol dehydrogenase family)
MSALTEASQEQHRQHSIDITTGSAPVYDNPDYKPAKKLQGKVALIIAGERGIGRAVAIAYAKEGALLAIVYQDNDKDAEETKRCAESYDSEVFLLKGNIANIDFARSCVIDTIEYFGQLDILVNNSCEQSPKANVAALTAESLKYMYEGAAIVNTSPVTLHQGHPNFINYSDVKDAISVFTRTLSNSIVTRGIRVNAVAPGPVWTPFNISAFDEDETREFGRNTPMQRAGQPYELAPAYVYLACNDSSYMSGQTLYINGGKFINP